MNLSSSTVGKVVTVIHFPEFGGPTNQALRLSEPLAARQWSLVTVLPSGQGSERLVAGGAQVRSLPLGRVRAVASITIQAKMLGRLPLDLIQLARLFRTEQPDVVQISGLMNPHAAYVARAMRIPVVWQIVDTRPPMKLRRIMMAQIKWLADVVMPIGEAVRDLHPGAVDFDERCVLFYPPVDLDIFNSKGESGLRKELGIEPSARVVSIVGNVNPQKGHEYLIRSAKLVREKYPDAVFVIAGAFHTSHSHYLKSLHNLADEMGLEIGKHLFFLGSRPDVANVLLGSDVFALASVPNSEGLPTVILEAMACGVPVVATDVASVKEAVAEGETGFVVPSLDVETMAARISQLLGDDELRKRMGLAARTRAEVHFSIDHYVDAHIRAYELAIAHRKGRRRAEVLCDFEVP